MGTPSNKLHLVGTLEASLQAILSSAVDAIVIIQHGGVIETVNQAAARLFQYEIEEFIGQNVKFLMPQPDRRDHDAYLHNYHTTGRRKIIGIGREVRGLRKDGSIFPMHLSVGEFFENDTKYYTGIIHDLTDRKEAEEALLQAQKMDAIGQLTGGVAHDFNNLLTVILGNLELLGMEETRDEHTILRIEAMEAAERAAQLTARLLAYARRSPLAPQVVDLNVLIEGLADLLQRTLGATIQLETHLTPEPWLVNVDPSQFENAIVNLAVNARDAMATGGRLIVETQNSPIDDEIAAEELGLAQDDYVQVSVTDSGAGMHSNVVQRVFEPFFTTKEVGQGTGLGLSMIYGFAKQSGGHVTIYSELEKGTTVNMYLPRNKRDLQNHNTRRVANLEKPKNERTILIVEDDDRIRRMTRTRLEALGYNVLEAADGVTAVQVLKDVQEIHLVFTDLVMPNGMSGYDVANYVHKSHPKTKVLLTSGYAEELMNGDRLKSHDLKLLRKPYRQAALAKAVADEIGCEC